MKAYWIEPTDVLFFRDGKPMGSSGAYSESASYPPHPSVVYGALRSALAGALGVKWDEFRRNIIPDSIKDLIGTPSGPGRFRIDGVLAAEESGGKIEPLFPVPTDIVAEKGGSGLIFLTIAGGGFMTVHPDHGLALLVARTSSPVEKASGFLKSADFGRYLSGEVPPAKDVVKTSSLYEMEPRLGIGLDLQKRTSAKNAQGRGMLYTLNYIRARARFCESGGRPPSRSGLMALLNAGSGSGAPKSGVLRLGGESRTAAFRETDANIPAPPSGAGRKAKVVLAGPALFEGGWHPKSVAREGSGWTWKGRGFRAKLVAAALGRSVPVGGFDLAAQWPKPIRPAAAPGSVYFLELVEGGIDNVVSELHGRTISDADQDCASGFGLAFVGRWE